MTENVDRTSNQRFALTLLFDENAVDGRDVMRAVEKVPGVTVEAMRCAPDETTTPRVTPVEVERLIDWHRMAAGVTEQTDDFVGARMHRERLRVWEAHRRGSPVEPSPIPASIADQASIQRVGSAVAGGGSENGSEAHNKGE